MNRVLIRQSLIYTPVFSGYLDYQDDYSSVDDVIISAAETSSLFGSNSFQVLQIKNAWYAAGVLSTAPQQVQLTGPSSGYVCYSGSTITATNCPTGSTISWTTSPNLVVQSGGNTATPTIRAATSATSGEGWIQINFTSNGYAAAGPKISVWAGVPGVPTTNPTGYPTIELSSGEMLQVSLSDTPRYRINNWEMGLFWQY